MPTAPTSRTMLMTLQIIVEPIGVFPAAGL